MIRRREFIAGLGSAAAWPMVAGAQQAAVAVIGYLNPQSADNSKNVTLAFLQGLKESGYVEGRNVAVEYRYAENQFDRLPGLAAILVRRRVAVTVAGGTPQRWRRSQRPRPHRSSLSPAVTRSQWVLSPASAG